MSILDRVLARPAAPRAEVVTASPGALENPTTPLTSTALLQALNLEANSTSSITVTETTALTMPAVWRAINVIAGTGGSLPLHAYRKVPDPDTGEFVNVQVMTGNAARLLDNMHPDLEPTEIMELVFAHLCAWGNAYLYKLRDQGGAIRELWPLDPARVRPGRAKDLTKVYEVDGYAPKTDAEILHIPGFGFNGICGFSPVRMARQGIGLALAMEEFGSRLFANGSLAAGVLQTDMVLTEPQATALKERWEAKSAGLAHAHEVAVLDAGAQFHQLTIPPEDAQFLQSRSFQIEEVARIYGVPPHMLMALEKTTSWGTGVEEQGLNFVRYTLRNYLTRVERRVTRVLKPEPVYARFSVEGLLRADSQGRAEFYTKLFNLGVLSTNDIRRLEELPPVTGGDVRYRPLNMGLLGQADTPGAVPTAQLAAIAAMLEAR